MLITVGAGKDRPQGRRAPLPAASSTAAALLEALRALPAKEEGWWSPHGWEGDYRKTEGWNGAVAVAVDIDYHDADGKHVQIPPELAAEVRGAVEAGRMPGNIFHPTPRGFRLVFALSERVTTADAFQASANRAGDLVQVAIEKLAIPGLRIDARALMDRARFLYSPGAIVGGRAREPSLALMREEPIDVAGLSSSTVWKLVSTGSVEIEEAVRKYNDEHPKTYPRNGGDCPVCQHKGCFGTVPENGKWSCFSDAHAGAGRRGEQCWTGDSLDIDAFEARMTPIDLLKVKGYLKRTVTVGSGNPAEGAQVLELAPDEPDRIIASNSYSSICFILRTPELREKVLGRGALEWNLHSMMPTLNRRQIKEETVLRIRELCEVAIKDSKGRGYKYSRQDVSDALVQVARERPFHPTRDYLHSLAWDGKPRIGLIAGEILGAPAEPLAPALLRKWLISAVARAEEPGCKVDSVLILVGDQGAGKSTFFSVLAGDWFCDSEMKPGTMDSYLLLQGTWIFEWAELEAMSRARSSNAVKAFLSSRSDKYRAPYEREPRVHPRACVIVGSTNDDEFLSDITGNRRFWTVKVGRVDVARLAAWRDQIWAEAMAYYLSEEGWHLTQEEEDSLAGVQTTHVSTDPWDEIIARYLAEHPGATTTSTLLIDALRKPVDRLDRNDQMRVGAILRRLQYRRVQRWVAGKPVKVWLPPTEPPF